MTCTQKLRKVYPFTKCFSIESMIVPQQSNEVDCGFYACMFLKSLAFGLQFSGAAGTDNDSDIGRTIRRVVGLELSSNSIRMPRGSVIPGLNEKYITGM